MVRNDFIEVQFRAFHSVFVWHDNNRIMLAGISLHFVLLRYCYPLLANFIHLFHSLAHSPTLSLSLSRSLPTALLCCWLECNVVAVGHVNVNIWMIWNFISNLPGTLRSFILILCIASISIGIWETVPFHHLFYPPTIYLRLVCKVWNKTKTKGWRNGTWQKEGQERGEWDRNFEEFAFGLFVYHFVTVGPVKLSIEYNIPSKIVSHVHQQQQQ